MTSSLYSSNELSTFTSFSSTSFSTARSCSMSSSFHFFCVRRAARGREGLVQHLTLVC